MGRRIAIRAHIVVGRMGWPICLIHSRLSPQALLAVPSSLRSSAAAERRSVNATGLRTALRRCDLGAELPLLAETCRSICVHSYIVCQIKPKLLHIGDTNEPVEKTESTVGQRLQYLGSKKSEDLRRSTCELGDVFPHSFNSSCQRLFGNTCN
jgi:hypothetical protein